MFVALAGFAGQASLQAGLNGARRLWRQFRFVPPRERGIDPVGEAEVYLAYGRTDDAVWVLRDTLRRESDNTAAKVTLLRAYSQQNDASAYHALAESLRPELQHHPLWDTVCQVGRELCPGTPLFQ